MRILFVNQYYPPDASNSAYILGELTEDLARHHDVEVVAGTPSYNAAATSFEPVGVTVTRVRSTTFHRRSLAGRIVNYLSFCVLAPLRAMTRPRPDLVVAMTDPPVAGVLGALVALRHRVPLVVIMHDVYPEIAVALGALHSPRAVSAWRAVNRWVRRRAAAIFVVGRDMRERLEADGVAPAKLSVVPTWASAQDLDAGRRATVRAEMGWEDEVIAMHAGNVGLAQNLDVVLDAARLAEPGVRFVILGDGASKQRLEQRARDEALGNVDFLPHCEKDRAQELMAAADLHIVTLVPGLWGCAAPSKTYGIMAAGRPFVAAVDEGSEPARIADDYDCGAHVRAGDGPALAAAISDLRARGLDTLGARARGAFERHYTREQATTRTRHLLEDLMSIR